MFVRFWGTRGSIAKSGERFLRYGGNTACVEVRSDAGHRVILDCGTGAHDLGQALVKEPSPPKGAILISHTHWDHIQGFPFFAPLFVPDSEWDIYAPRGLGGSLRDTLAGQMQYAYFPITLETLGATLRYHELVEGVFEFGDIRVRTHYLDHPALTLGYRLEADGAAVVYACDHEPISRCAVHDEAGLGEAEQGHIDFLKGADLVIHDAQFTAEEYAERKGWGHGTADYATAVCLAAGARRLAFTHHDPNRSDDEIDAIVKTVRDGLEADGQALQVAAAAEGDTIEVGGAGGVKPRREDEARADTPVDAGDKPQRVVACGVQSEAMRVICAAAVAERLPVTREMVFSMPVADAIKDGRSLVIMDAEFAADNKAAIRHTQAAGYPACPPIVIATSDDESRGGMKGLEVDRLVWPFSKQYAQTKIRAEMLRTQCRWQRARRPADEADRLAELHRLGILDTRREERFDRITRIAMGAFEPHAALITLIDETRQWFKACVGLAGTETTREQAFCAHAILHRAPLIVQDALKDHRFADNPLVAGEPHIRFYAGCPILSPRNLPLGTLCIIDTRPRDLNAEQVRLLTDLASLVEQEIAAGAPS